jgi:hypothetical protein
VNAEELQQPLARFWPQFYAEYHAIMLKKVCVGLWLC